MLEMKTKLGYKISSNQTVSVMEDGLLVERKTSELKSGDCIGVSGTPERLSTSKFVEFNEKTYEGEDLGVWLGYFIANGNIRKNAVCFSNSDEIKAQDYINTTKSLFGLKVCRYKYEKSTESLVVNSSWLEKCLSEIFNGNCVAKNKFIPQIFYNINTIRGLLRSLFDCDACYTESSGFIWTTASEELAMQVHSLLLDFGVISSKREIRNVKGYEDRVYHSVSIYSKNIDRLFEEILFDTKKYHRKGRKNTNSNLDVFPGLGLRLKDKITQVKLKLGVSRAGKYLNKEGKYENFSLAKNLYEVHRKELTREKLEKILLEWNSAPKEQADLIKEEIIFVNGLLKSKMFFDFVL